MGALRDKLIISLLVLLAVGSSLAIFMGSSAAEEQSQFTLVFAAGGLRLTGVLGLVLFVVFFVRRSFEGKDVEFLLSRPISRVAFLLSYSTAFVILAAILTVSIGVCIVSVSPHLVSSGHTFWLLSVLVENIIMVNAALFFAMYMSSASSGAMATFAFYVLGRMMGQLLGIVDSELVVDTGPMAMAVQLASVITPRLDLLGQTSWLLYGVDQAVIGFGFVCLQGVFFCSLVFLAALLDLLNRQF